MSSRGTPAPHVESSVFVAIHSSNCTRKSALYKYCTLNSEVDVSHSFFFGRQNFVLLYANYTMLTSNSALSIQHSKFYNGSGSVSVYILNLAEYSSFVFEHETCYVQDS